MVNAIINRSRPHEPKIQELDDIHRALDTAVLRAYGWPADLPNEAILERLLALNLARAGEQSYTPRPER